MADAVSPVGHTSVRVRYAETDQQGIAHHAHYFVWMELGRTALLRDLGFPYDRVEAEGLVFTVVEASCRFVGAARYDEEVEIETRVGAVRSRTAAFDTTLRVAGRPIARGSVTLAALDSRRRPGRVPTPLVAALRGAARS